MPDPIYDAKGTEITIGARVKPLIYMHVPGGVVTKLEEMDVDMNDNTGRPEAYGPFVHVLYDDGEEDRWTAYTMRGGEYVCDEVEVEVEVEAFACPECGTEMIRNPYNTEVLLHVESTDCAPEPWPTPEKASLAAQERA